MNCKVCGAPIPEGMVFCIRCGSKVTPRDEVQTDAGETSESQGELNLDPLEACVPPTYSEPQSKSEKQSEASSPEEASIAEALPAVPVEQEQPSIIAVKPVSRKVIVAAGAAVFAAIVLAFVLMPRLKAEKTSYDGDTYGTNLTTLLQGGFFATSGSDLYFTPNLSVFSSDTLSTPRIYRTNIDTGESQLVYDATNGGEYGPSVVNGLQVVDGRLVFFEKRAPGAEGGDSIYHIVSIALDGSDLQELAILDDSNGWYGTYGEIQAYEGKIYFKDKDAIYVIDLDGSDRQHVYDLEEISRWVVYNDTVYTYVYDSSSGKRLIKTCPLGEEVDEVVYSSSNRIDATFSPLGDEIYLVEYNDGAMEELGFTEPLLVRYNMATGDKETIFTSSDGGGSDLSLLAVDSKGVVFWCNSSVWSYSSDTDSCTKIMKYDYSLLDNSNDVLNQSASDIWSADIFGCVGGNMLFHPVRTDINDLFSYDSVDPNLNWDNFDNYLENGYSYYCAINRETGDFKSFFKQDSNT